ncbi:MAG: hypothetical protein ABW047_14835, partial [Nitrospiraceae bacterium]
GSTAIADSLLRQAYPVSAASTSNSQTLGAHKTLPAHGTRPAHHSRASTTVALIILRAVDLAGAHRHSALYSSHRAPHYSSRRGPRDATTRFRDDPS